MTQQNENARELTRLLAAECATTQDIATLLKSLFAGTIEQMLESEMEEHLGYIKNSVEGNNSGNSRNGYGKKTIKSEWGESEISVPRDRNGEFEPRVIEKRQTRTDEIERRILAMYAKGISVRDIEDQLRDIYGAEVSPALISNITDKILPEVTEWQNRPLDELYPVVFFDGIWFKMRKDSKVVKVCVYTVLGITMEGRKGIWNSTSESASFWTTVFNEKTNVEDHLKTHSNTTIQGGETAKLRPKSTYFSR